MLRCGDGGLYYIIPNSIAFFVLEGHELVILKLQTALPIAGIRSNLFIILALDESYLESVLFVHGFRLSQRLGKVYTWNFRLLFSDVYFTKCSSLHFAVALVVLCFVLYFESEKKKCRFSVSFRYPVTSPQAKASNWKTHPMPVLLLSFTSNPEYACSWLFSRTFARWNFLVAQILQLSIGGLVY